MARVETIMKKGDFAHDKQFLLLSPCFQMSSAAHVAQRVCKRERDYPYPLQLLVQTNFDHIVVNGAIADNKLTMKITVNES